jgi:hypothetical protein
LCRFIDPPVMVLISDGEVNQGNLRRRGLTAADLEAVLREHGHHNTDSKGSRPRRCGESAIKPNRLEMSWWNTLILFASRVSWLVRRSGCGSWQHGLGGASSVTG